MDVAKDMFKVAHTPIPGTPGLSTSASPGPASTPSTASQGLFDLLVGEQARTGWKGLKALSQWSVRKAQVESDAAAQPSEKVAAALAHYDRMNTLCLTVEIAEGPPMTRPATLRTRSWSRLKPLCMKPNELAR